MTRIQAILRSIFLVAWTAAAAASPLAGPGEPEEVDVVVNKGNNAGPLSVDEVRRIFLGEKSSWPGGKRITVLMMAPDTVERQVILKEVFRMNESDYTKYFLQAAFTGRVQAAPRDLRSAAQMKAQLVANPNAIGYLKKQDVDEGLKVVLKLTRAAER